MAVELITFGMLAIPLLMLTPASALVTRRGWFAPAIGFACVVLLIVGMGLNQPVLAGRRIPQTTEFAELARRGWSDGDLRKLAGENLLRVFARAEAVSKRLKREAR